MTTTKSMGQIGYEAWRDRLLGFEPRIQPWDAINANSVRRLAAEESARAVSVATLERIAAAGVSAEDALRGLRDGKTIEDVCVEWTAKRARRATCTGNPSVCDWEAPHGVDRDLMPSINWAVGDAPQHTMADVEAGIEAVRGVGTVVEGAQSKPSRYDVTDE